MLPWRVEAVIKRCRTPPGSCDADESFSDAASVGQQFNASAVRFLVSKVLDLDFQSNLIAGHGQTAIRDEAGNGQIRLAGRFALDQYDRGSVRECADPLATVVREHLVPRRPPQIGEKTDSMFGQPRMACRCRLDNTLHFVQRRRQRCSAV